jgi:Bacterial PH domain
MMSETGGPEHDFEPVPGLPAHLPEGEHIIWQGRPTRAIVLRRLLRARWIATYFGLAALWALMVGINDGVPTGALLLQLGYVGVLALVVFVLLGLFAHAVSRTSLYTITNRRVVMRVGIALSAIFNLPFTQVEGADFRERADGTGDIALSLKPGHSLSSAVFWPHQRGAIWRKLTPQLICLPDVRLVAERLALQLQAHSARNVVAGIADAEDAPQVRIRPARGAAAASLQTA